MAATTCPTLRHESSRATRLAKRPTLTLLGAFSPRTYQQAVHSASHTVVPLPFLLSIAVGNGLNNAVLQANHSVVVTRLHVQ